MRAADAGTLHHTGFVVHDVEATARALKESLSIGPWSIWMLELSGGTVRGRDADFTLRIGMAPVGDSNIELLTPVSGETVYVEHLELKGEGFHHTCIAYPSTEALRSARAALTGQGREPIMSGRLGETGEFYYFDVLELGGVVELMHPTELPPPDLTID